MDTIRLKNLIYTTAEAYLTTENSLNKKSQQISSLNLDNDTLFTLAFRCVNPTVKWYNVTYLGQHQFKYWYYMTDNKTAKGTNMSSACDAYPLGYYY